MLNSKTKKLAATCCAVALVATCSISAFAAESASSTPVVSGNTVCVNLDNYKGGEMASKVEKSYLGGLWNYGSEGLNLWSNFWHGQKNHWSSVQAGNGSAVKMDHASAGEWSEVSTLRNVTGGNIAKAGVN